MGRARGYVVDDEAAQRFLAALEQPSPAPNEACADLASCLQG
jgi:uncharacterized protein (DUF1778 family)